MYNVLDINSRPTAYIDGQKGIYDGKVKNNSVRYGRNAIANHKEYLSHYGFYNPIQPPKLTGLSQANQDVFERKMVKLDKYIEGLDNAIKNMAPIDFGLSYSPHDAKKDVDTLALMGASFEELGKKTFVSVGELTKPIQANFGEDFNAEAVDLNKDNKIDIAEYATTILLSDALGSYNQNCIGFITNEGQKQSIPYSHKKNFEIANKTYQALYEKYDLKQAQKEFLSDANNLIQ